MWFLRTILCSQLGLFVEFSPEDMLLGMEETEDDGDLEAELLALTGEAGVTGRKPTPKGQGEFAVLNWLIAGTRRVQAGGREGSLLIAGRSQLDHLVLLIPILLQPSHQEAVLPCSYTCVIGSSSLL